MKTKKVKRSFTKGELAAAYDISLPTFNKWVIKAGINIGYRRIYTPSEVELIFAALGNPSLI